MSGIDLCLQGMIAGRFFLGPRIHGSSSGFNLGRGREAREVFERHAAFKALLIRWDGCTVGYTATLLDFCMGAPWQHDAAEKRGVGYTTAGVQGQPSFRRLTPEPGWCGAEGKAISSGATASPQPEGRLHRTRAAGLLGPQRTTTLPVLELTSFFVLGRE